ncbi:ecdysone oxidase-like [Centruroides vittatus]|uniref:ecdysone oxidase-like n=1 Tax=Centruroides vittatus TaxID=120091 RepID=UPI00351030DA
MKPSSCSVKTVPHSDEFQFSYSTETGCPTAISYDTLFPPEFERNGAHFRLLVAVSSPMSIHNKRAYKVKFEHNRELYEAYTKHVMIVSTKVFNSPKLLMLSGIGPKHTLENGFTSWKKSLRTITGMAFEAKTYSYSIEGITVINYNKFLVNGTGPLSCLGKVDTIGFVNYKYNNELEWPDIELLWLSLSPASDNGTILRRVQPKRRNCSSVTEIKAGRRFITIYGMKKVKGIEGLRVADASIMLFVVTGHLNIPICMIGEKAADMILCDLFHKHE